MSAVENFTSFVREQLISATEEIVAVFEKIVVEYEKEIERQRILLDIVLKPEVKLHRIEPCREGEGHTEPQLSNQGTSTAPAQDPELSLVKEEPEEVFISAEGEQFVPIVPKKEEEENISDLPVCEVLPQLVNGGYSTVGEDRPYATKTTPPENVCEEEEGHTEQQLGNQERISSLEQADPEPSLVEAEVVISLEGEPVEPDEEEDEDYSDFVFEGLDDEDSEYLPDKPITPTEFRSDPPNLRTKSGSDKLQLIKKIRNRKRKKTFSCIACGKRVLTREHLTIHERSKPRKVLRCSTCGKRFKKCMRLKVHLRTNKGCGRERDGLKSLDNSDPGWSKEGWKPSAHPFTESAGPRGPAAELQSEDPVDFLELFLTNELLLQICEQTNLYAKRYIASHSNPSAQSRVHSWKAMDIKELKQALGLLFLTGIIRKKKIENYWQTGVVDATPYFGQTMTQDRFKLIFKFLHFADKSSKDDSSDPMFKVRPVLSYIVEKFKELYQPGENISIDKGMMQWRGRLAFRMHNLKKPIKYGIKSYILCDSSTGYCFNMVPYTGEKSKRNDIVSMLLDRLKGQGYTLYMDNFFNSVSLCSQLLGEQTNVCGMLRINRGEPKAIREVTMKSLKTGDTLMRHNGKVMVVAWRDKELVRMVSTCHQAQIENAKVFKSGEGTVSISQPVCVASYRKYMSGVQKLDQSITYCPIVWKSLRWTRKFVFYLLQMCLFNASIVYNEKNREKNMTRWAFIMSVARAWTKPNGEKKKGDKLDVEKEARCGGGRGKRGQDPFDWLYGKTRRHKDYTGPPAKRRSPRECPRADYGEA